MQVPAEAEAVLLAKDALVAERVPVTARVHAPPGSILMRLDPEVPVKDALPATVMVRLDKAENEEGVPLVTVKLPELVTVMFLPFRSRVPALWLKLRQERSYAVNWRVPAPEWEMPG